MPEVQEIFEKYGAEHCRSHTLSPEQGKVMPLPIAGRPSWAVILTFAPPAATPGRITTPAATTTVPSVRRLPESAGLTGTGTKARE